MRFAGVTTQDAPDYLREFEHITLARLLVARGDSGEALALLDRLGDAAASGGRLTSVIEVNVLTALACRDGGDTQRALAALGKAIDLAAPERQKRLFTEEGTSLHDLLTLLQKRAANPLLQALLARGAERQLRVASNYELVEPLSVRELDVLRLLRSDLSGPELAQQLSVSLNTLRTHTKNIFEKLGVNSRRAAVRRADEMNLFGH